MPYTHDPTVVAQYIKDLVEVHKDDPGVELADVFFGDQQLIPRYPACCVWPAGKSNSLTNVGMQLDVVIEVVLMVYFGKLQDVQVNDKRVGEISEALEDILHSDRNMGGSVIHGNVSRNEPGYVSRSNTLQVASRITWQGISRKRI